MQESDDIPLMFYSHCRFDSPNDVYIMMAIARKKDHEDITNSQEIVFRKVIKNGDDIYRKYKELKILCENYRDEEGKKYNFYIYISVNPRDTEKAFFLLQKQMIGWTEEMVNGIDKSKQLKKVDDMWISALMKSKSKRGKFQVDIDVKDEKELKEIVKLIEEKSIMKIHMIQPTRHGYHLITEPFDRRILEGIKDVEVKPDGQLFVEYVNNGSL